MAKIEQVAQNQEQTGDNVAPNVTPMTNKGKELAKAKEEGGKKKAGAKEQPSKSASYMKKLHDFARFQLLEGANEEEAILEVSSKMRCGNDTATEVVSSIYKELHKFIGFNGLPLAEQYGLYLSHFRPRAKRSQISGRLEEDGRELDLEDLNNLRIDMNIFGAKVSEANFYIFINSKYTPRYHPIKDYFAKFDGKEATKGNIAQVAQSINSKSGLDDYEFYPEFVETMLKRWLIGVIASVDGHKNNLYLILVGPQRSGKTEFFRRLMPEGLKRFFAETKLESRKSEADIAMVMCETLVIFDDEMAGKSREDWAFMKSTLEKDTYTVRKPYGKGYERIKRIASCCGTTNEEEILGDLTGNRRYIPIATGDVLDFEAYNSIDKEELWHEAYALYKAGEPWELSREEITMLNECTTRFERTDELAEGIMQLYDVPSPTDTRIIEKLTATQIAQDLRIIGIKCNPVALGMRLKKLGFSQTMTTKEKAKTRLYSVCLRNVQKSQI